MADEIVSKEHEERLSESETSFSKDSDVSSDIDVSDFIDERKIIESDTARDQKKVRDYFNKEMIDDGSSDNVSNSSDVEVDSYIVEGEEYHDFIEEDGISYMFISDSSMTRQFILLKEEEDENWFPKKKVYKELGMFVKC